MIKVFKKSTRFAETLFIAIMLVLPTLSIAAVTMTTNVASPQIAAESLAPAQASVLFIVDGANNRADRFIFSVREQGSAFVEEQNIDASTAPFGAFLFRWLTSDPKFAPAAFGQSRTFDIKVDVRDSSGALVGSVTRVFQLDPLGNVPPDPNSFFGLVDSTTNESFELDGQNPRFNSTTAAAYYRAVDPNNERDTFSKFLQKNSMVPAGVEINPGTPGAPGDDQVITDAHALYINKIDLGFARNFYLRTDPATGNIASYTENYPSIQEGVDRTNVIAIVAMEYRADAGGLISFYAYNGAGARLQAADLDGRGFKAIPGTCVVCHGGSPAKNIALDDPNTIYPNGGDLGSSFLPWDINAFTFGTGNFPTGSGLNQGKGLSRTAQEADIKILNQAVLSTLTGNEFKSPEQELIEGWYGGVDANGQLINPVYNGDFVPTGWRGVEESDIYLHVVRETCRGCHISQPDDLAFGSSDAFDEYNEATQELCFDVLNDSTGGGGAVMPEAQETFQRHFWAPNKDGDIPADLLRTYLATKKDPDDDD